MPDPRNKSTTTVAGG